MSGMLVSLVVLETDVLVSRPKFRGLGLGLEHCSRLFSRTINN